MICKLIKKLPLFLSLLVLLSSCSKDEKITAPYISVSQTHFAISGKVETISLKVSSNTEWRIYGDDWLQIIMCEKSIDGKSTEVTIKAEENKSEKEREGILYVDGTSLTKEILVLQSIKDTIHTAYKEYYATWTTTTLDIPVKSSIGSKYTVTIPEKAQNWLSLDNSSDNGIIKFNLKENNTGIIRSTEISLTNSSNKKEFHFKLTQGTPQKILTYITLDDKEVDVPLDKNETEITSQHIKNIPNARSIRIPYGITSIGNKAFEGYPYLQEVFVPCTVEKIEEEAFLNAKYLQRIDLPDNISYIGEGAFSGCSNLLKITIPKNIKVIPKNFCYEAEWLEEITFHQEVIEIGDNAFNGCMCLKRLKLPYGIQKLGKNAFKACYWLKSLNLPSTLKKIGDHAFSNCKHITDVNIPFVEEFEEYVFGGCFSLKSAIMQPGFKAVPPGTFSGCPIEDLVLPKGIKEYGEFAFSGCCFKSFELDENAISIGRFTFSGCSQLESINIPNTITSIPEGAFMGCITITKIDLPKSVTQIESHAFDGCKSLTKIILPEKIGSLPPKALYDCTSLKTVEIHALTPPKIFDSSAFPKNDNMQLKVPKSSVKTYRDSEYAQYFKTITAL